MPPVQTPLVQSPGPLHIWFGPHCGQGPPQSMSVSMPFFTPSMQFGTWHTPPVQTLLMQSVPTAQVFPSLQAMQTGPPQSTSVSLAFFTWSVQVGRQIEPEQEPPTQSLSIVQPRPGPHLGQVAPPQSTSVS